MDATEKPDRLSQPEVAALMAEDGPALFLRGDVYGTRCSTLIAIAANGSAQIVERRYEAGGRPAGTTALKFSIG